MTIQVKRFIELSDIIGLRLECRGCGCAVSIGKHGEPNADSMLSAGTAALTRCPSCQKAWTVLEGYNNYDSAIKEFFRRVREIKTLEKAFGCTMTLEISGTDKT